MSINRWISAIAASLLFALNIHAQSLEPIPVIRPEINAAPGTSVFVEEISPVDGDVGRFWFRGDYLLGWIQNTHLPPLVTTSPAGTARSLAGNLAASDTAILFGGPANDRYRSGLRLQAAWSFDAEQKHAIEVGFMMLEGQSALFAASSVDGSSILAQPFINQNTGNPDAVLIGFPGAITGSVSARAHTGNLYEAHVDLTERALDFGWSRLFSIVGYRFYRFDESLTISQTINPTEAPFTVGTQITGTDSFTTRNNFHGLDLGFRSQFFWQNLSLDLTAKVAVGRVFSDVAIDGQQIVNAPNAATVTNVGNIYALTSNIGTRSISDWRAMPEAGADFAWQIRPNVKLRAGYSVLVLLGIARAADQVDTTINRNLFPPAIATTGRPSVLLNRTDVWVQNLNFGLEFTY